MLQTAGAAGVGAHVPQVGATGAIALTAPKLPSQSSAAPSQGASMPESLKAGAKDALAQVPNGYNQFTKISKDVKGGALPAAQGIGLIEKLLQSRPALVEQFKTWTKALEAGPVDSAPAAPVRPVGTLVPVGGPPAAAAAGGTPAALGGAPAAQNAQVGADVGDGLPESLKSGVKAALKQEDWKKFVETVRGLKGGTKKPSDAMRVVRDLLLGVQQPALVEQFEAWCKSAGLLRPSILSDPQLDGHQTTSVGDGASALAHIQAFPHGSRAFSYLVDPDKSAPATHAAAVPLSPQQSFATALQSPGTRARPSAQVRDLPTSLTPDLPIRLGGGMRQPLVLDLAIRQLDALLQQGAQHRQSEARGQLPSAASGSSTPSTGRCVREWVRASKRTSERVRER